jgi:hypothetical protein
MSGLYVFFQHIDKSSGVVQIIQKVVNITNRSFDHLTMTSAITAPSLPLYHQSSPKHVIVEFIVIDK